MTPSALAQRELGASAQAIQSHYDVSNDFYALWLDPSMTYSCALWEGAESLEEAQHQKIDYHTEQAGAAHAARVLDIGCGWGAALDRLVNVHHVRKAVGLTLSQAQFDWIRERRDDRIEVALMSWKDHRPDEPYDAIISVGAFEHFASVGLTPSEKHQAYRDFFHWSHRHLRKDARLSLQTIVYENFNVAAGNAFVSEIFPESDLPRLAEIVIASEGLFEIVRMRSDRQHYARTLRAWYHALRRSRQRIVQRFGAPLYEKYERYLGIFIVGFHTGTVNLSRLTLRKIESPATA